MACGYATNPKSSTAVVEDTLVAWAVNGTGGTQPSGFYLAENRVVDVTSSLTFDVAFDVDSATGLAVVTPVRLITDGSVLGFHVGLQRLTQPFDSVDIRAQERIPVRLGLHAVAGAGTHDRVEPSGLRDRSESVAVRQVRRRQRESRDANGSLPCSRRPELRVSGVQRQALPTF